VTAVSATSLTVKSEDGYTKTYVLNPSTVVVAGSPINTARLLLLSANGKHPRGLGNRSDQVGRNVHVRSCSVVAVICLGTGAAVPAPAVEKPSAADL